MESYMNKSRIKKIKTILPGLLCKDRQELGLKYHGDLPGRLIRQIFQLFIAGGALFLFAQTAPLPAQSEKLHVVTTTTDLAYLAQQVAGDRAQVNALIGGNIDPHYAQARPDYIVRLNRADVFVQVGLELESGWVPPLLRSARNRDIMPGGRGYCDASVGIHVLEKPEQTISRSMGHLHPFGNPHYWTDPLNASIMARNIRDALIRVDPDGIEIYNRNYANLHESLKQLTLELTRNYAQLRGLQVAVYHKEFTYFTHRFGMESAVSIEEKPGVVPSAAYLEEVVRTMQSRNIRLILISPYNNPRYAEQVAERTGARIVVMPLSTGSDPHVQTYPDTLRVMLQRIQAALAEKNQQTYFVTPLQKSTPT